jgi:hypothetical protein
VKHLVRPTSNVNLHPWPRHDGGLLAGFHQRVPQHPHHADYDDDRLRRLVG